ncbi:hypothetical protein HZH68_014502 [Vespula germanica]|uniref:Uncharacterized protein n=1 Tax=Vespula germanica TaxID=30212 RepID=A0A834MSL5_VESGE|nr:hypothetical protein HZH68_014502 [Vespula germanica]
MVGKEKRMVGTKSFDLWFRPTMSGYDVSKNIDDYDKERDVKDKFYKSLTAVIARSQRAEIQCLTSSPTADKKKLAKLI